MILLAMFAVMTSGNPLRVATPVVDRCELNHVTYENSETSFSQVILWRWYSHWPIESGFLVAEYFMIDGDVRIIWKNGRKHVVWRDRSGICYEVMCSTFSETSTCFDPEMLDRQKWPVERRTPYFR